MWVGSLNGDRATPFPQVDSERQDMRTDNVPETTAYLRYRHMNS